MNTLQVNSLPRLTMNEYLTSHYVALQINEYLTNEYLTSSYSPYKSLNKLQMNILTRLMLANEQIPSLTLRINEYLTNE